jgi:dihydrofolate reductase
MRKIILYTAVSLDNYIAQKNGDLKWLDSFPNPDNEDYGYSEFYRSIDTTLMGNKTFKKILSFGMDFPYKDKTNYVFTKSKNLNDGNYISYINNSIVDFVSELKTKKGKDIWLVGGGQINGFFLEHNLIDVIILTLLPVFLGKGIPLFEGVKKKKVVNIRKVKRFKSGIIQLFYSK